MGDVISLSTRYPLHISLSNSAPDFKGTFFAADKFPPEVMQTIEVAGFTGSMQSTGGGIAVQSDGQEDGVFFTCALNTEEGRELLSTSTEKDELGRSVATGRACGMHTIVTTTFQLEDYKEFLDRQLDFDMFQVIHVSDEPTWKDLGKVERGRD